MPSFSKRYGYSPDPEVRFIGELPGTHRRPILEIANRYVRSKDLFNVVETVLNPYGLDPRPPMSIRFFVPQDLDLIAASQRIDSCEWYHVYDVIEAVCRFLRRNDSRSGIPIEGAPLAPAFERDLNRYFVTVGIGWQLVEGKVVRRGDSAFELTLQAAAGALTSSDLPTAAQRLNFAVMALSARPLPDTTGAVSHATGSLECVLGEVTGSAGRTLGQYLSDYPSLFHPALKKALNGIWGYASDAGARHGREDVQPTYDEAAFVVAVCAATCALLTKQLPHASE